LYRERPAKDADFILESKARGPHRGALYGAPVRKRVIRGKDGPPGGNLDKGRSRRPRPPFLSIMQGGGQRVENSWKGGRGDFGIFGRKKREAKNREGTNGYTQRPKEGAFALGSERGRGSHVRSMKGD